MAQWRGFRSRDTVLLGPLSSGLERGCGGLEKTGAATGRLIRLVIRKIMRNYIDSGLHPGTARRPRNKYLLPMSIAFGMIPMIGVMTLMPLGFVAIFSPLSLLQGDPQFMLLLLPFLPFVVLRYSRNEKLNKILEYAGIAILSAAAIYIFIAYMHGGYVNMREGYFFSAWLILATTGFIAFSIAALFTAIRRQNEAKIANVKSLL